MLSAIRRYFDTRAECAAQLLLKADATMIDRWRMAVWQNIKARRGRWADVAYLKRIRARRYA